MEPHDEEHKVKATFAKYPTARARDEAIRNGSLLAGSASATSTPLDVTKASPWKAPTTGAADLMVSNQLPYSLILQKGSTRSLKIDEQRNIIGGEAKFFPSEMMQRRRGARSPR